MLFKTEAQIPSGASVPVMKHCVGKHFLNIQWKCPLLQLEFGVSCSFTACESLARSFLQLFFYRG